MGAQKNQLKASLLFISIFALGFAKAAVLRKKFSNRENYVKAEVLKDNIMHFEFAKGEGPLAELPIYSSPMLFQKTFPGAKSVNSAAQRIETDQLLVEVEKDSLCIRLTEKSSNTFLTRICPVQLDQISKGLTITQEQTQNVYGLGQEFVDEGNPNGDWIKHGRRNSGFTNYGGTFNGGNGFVPFGAQGMVGNIQIPVYYALGEKQSYLLFLDNVYRQDWTFNTSPWSVNMLGDQIRFYIVAAPKLTDLRREFMQLVGTPPVPPRKSFGLWVSQFGFESWEEVESKKKTLRENAFPVDGFVLDLQWFGGFSPENPDSRMGSLEWYEGPAGQVYKDFSKIRSNFPNPEEHIKKFADENIGLITIEESYVGKNLPSFAQLSERGGLAKTCDDKKTPIVFKKWFGEGGMIDWTNKEAAKFWHDEKRFKNIIQKGIIGHWTDLGEPELSDPDSCYATEFEPGKNRHPNIHNLYNLLWNESIYDGYVRHHDEVNRRPFILSRSGTAGSQRYGVGMWSGDISSELKSLATHFNVQMQMSFSGIDYYGSDIGGFHRTGLDPKLHNELYTEWFTNSTWFDVPVRPHTNNFDHRDDAVPKYFETAPDRVGRSKSNLANLRRRYELIPYYYSLAHLAYEKGEPVIPPPVFYEQNDQVLREMGDQKFIGKSILVAAVAEHGAFKRKMYLPAGDWINFYTNEWVKSQGEWTEELPLYRNEVFSLPAFVKAGALLPLMFVDGKTQDAFGHRADKTQRNELIVRAYAGNGAFTLYEDDGSTTDFDANSRPLYHTRTTYISQRTLDKAAIVTIVASRGHFANEESARNNVIEFVPNNAVATKVTLNERTGGDFKEFTSRKEFDEADAGWYNSGNVVYAKSGKMEIAGTTKQFKFFLVAKNPSEKTSVHFACKNGSSDPQAPVYVTGNTEALGNWDMSKAVRLDPSGLWDYTNNGATWTGIVDGLPSQTEVQWKCIVPGRNAEAEVQLISPVTTFKTKSADYSGTAEASF